MAKAGARHGTKNVDLFQHLQVEQQQRELENAKQELIVLKRLLSEKEDIILQLRTTVRKLQETLARKDKDLQAVFAVLRAPQDAELTKSRKQELIERLLMDAQLRTVASEALAEDRKKELDKFRYSSKFLRFQELEAEVDECHAEIERLRSLQETTARPQGKIVGKLRFSSVSSAPNHSSVKRAAKPSQNQSPEYHGVARIDNDLIAPHSSGVGHVQFPNEYSEKLSGEEIRESFVSKARKRAIESDYYKQVRLAQLEAECELKENVKVRAAREARRMRLAAEHQRQQEAMAQAKFALAKTSDIAVKRKQEEHNLGTQTKPMAATDPCIVQSPDEPAPSLAIEQQAAATAGLELQNCEAVPAARAPEQMSEFAENCTVSETSWLLQKSQQYDSETLASADTNTVSEDNTDCKIVEMEASVAATFREVEGSRISDETTNERNRDAASCVNLTNETSVSEPQLKENQDALISDEDIVILSAIDPCERNRVVLHTDVAEGDYPLDAVDTERQKDMEAVLSPESDQIHFVDKLQQYEEEGFDDVEEHGDADVLSVDRTAESNAGPLVLTHEDNAEIASSITYLASGVQSDLTLVEVCNADLEESKSTHHFIHGTGESISGSEHALQDGNADVVDAVADSSADNLHGNITSCGYYGSEETHFDRAIDAVIGVAECSNTTKHQDVEGQNDFEDSAGLLNKDKAEETVIVETNAPVEVADNALTTNDTQTHESALEVVLDELNNDEVSSSTADDTAPLSRSPLEHKPDKITHEDSVRDPFESQYDEDSSLEEPTASNSNPSELIAPVTPAASSTSSGAIGDVTNSSGANDINGMGESRNKALNEYTEPVSSVDDESNDAASEPEPSTVATLSEDNSGATQSEVEAPNTGRSSVSSDNVYTPDFTSPREVEDDN